MTNFAVNLNLINTKTLATVERERERERERAAFLNNNVGATISRPSTKNWAIYKKITTNQNVNHFGVWLFCVERNKGHPVVAMDTG